MRIRQALLRRASSQWRDAMDMLFSSNDANRKRDQHPSATRLCIAAMNPPVTRQVWHSYQNGIGQTA
jgi:hypothetical protein